MAWSLKKKCLCFRLRTGSCLGSIYTVVSSLVFLIVMSLYFYDAKHLDIRKRETQIVLYPLFGSYGLLMFATLALITGVLRRSTGPFVPWVVCGIIALCHGTAIVTWMLMKAVENLKKMTIAEMGILVYHILNNIMMVLCFVCVLSYAQRLANISKQRSRRHRTPYQDTDQCNRPAISTVTMDVLPPLPVIEPGFPALPPYTETSDDQPPPYPGLEDLPPPRYQTLERPVMCSHGRPGGVAQRILSTNINHNGDPIVTQV